MYPTMLSTFLLSDDCKHCLCCEFQCVYRKVSYCPVFFRNNSADYNKSTVKYMLFNSIKCSIFLLVDVAAGEDHCRSGNYYTVKVLVYPVMLCFVQMTLGVQHLFVQKIHALAQQ